jgi:hypothetical protein
LVDGLRNYCGATRGAGAAGINTTKPSLWMLSSIHEPNFVLEVNSSKFS